jgi:tripartite-type tricarboxylate transporter receptor subunit TctC
MNPLKTLTRIAAPLLIALAPASAALAAYPDKPVAMVVPFPPGGPTDLVARVIAKQLTEQMGQPVVVENKGGANASIGMQYVAAAKADGYTLLYNTSSIALNPNLYKNLAYNPAKDFAPISSTAVIPLVLLVHPSVPAGDVAGFADYARKQGGKLVYGSAGAGNVTHLGALLMLRALKAQATHAPYRGSAPAMTDLVGGHVQFMTNTLNDSLPFVRSGQLKALAVSSKKRSEQLPNVPTFDEKTVPGFEMGAWQGIVVPAGTPADIIQKLNAEIRKALAAPAVQAQLREQGAQVLGSSPKEYADYIRGETGRWGEVIREAGVQLN